MAKADYKSSGVDLDTYQEAMRRLPALIRRTHSPRVLPLEGGFAGLFKLDFDGGLFSRNYDDPVLVAGSDGVGTKLRVAQLAGRHDTIGIDLVAMCVNDVICCGAEPLFFLDYVAMSHDDPERLAQIVRGVSDGCLIADCALIGGETAIMPDLYQRGDYDLAGFCVGVAERNAVIDGKAVTVGDAIIGVASSGLHSNGFSLVRKVVFEIAGLSVADHVEELGGAVGETLLTPTTIYATPVRRILGHYRRKNVVHAIAHITGGGLRENLSRVLPRGVEANIDRTAWTVPAVFAWLERLGEIEPAEMDRVFNLGVGLVLVVSPYYAESIRSQLAALGLTSWQIGEIVANQPRSGDSA